MPNIETSYATGTFTGDGSAVKLECGFTPKKVTMLNSTDATKLEWFSGMPSPSAIKTVTVGTQTYETTGHISTWAGDAAGAALTGTAATTAGSPTLTGTSSKYLYELRVGDSINVGTATYVVKGVASATSITLDRPADATASGVTATRNTGRGPGFQIGTAATSAKVFVWIAE